MPKGTQKKRSALEGAKELARKRTRALQAQRQSALIRSATKRRSPSPTPGKSLSPVVPSPSRSAASHKTKAVLRGNRVDTRQHDNGRYDDDGEDQEVDEEEEEEEEAEEFVNGKRVVGYGPTGTPQVSPSASEEDPRSPGRPSRGLQKRTAAPSDASVAEAESPRKKRQVSRLKPRSKRTVVDIIDDDDDDDGEGEGEGRKASLEEGRREFEDPRKRADGGSRIPLATSATKGIARDSPSTTASSHGGKLRKQRIGSSRKDSPAASSGSIEKAAKSSAQKSLARASPAPQEDTMRRRGRATLVENAMKAAREQAALRIASKKNQRVAMLSKSRRHTIAAVPDSSGNADSEKENVSERAQQRTTQDVKSKDKAATAAAAADTKEATAQETKIRTPLAPKMKLEAPGMRSPPTEEVLGESKPSGAVRSDERKPSTSQRSVLRKMGIFALLLVLSVGGIAILENHPDLQTALDSGAARAREMASLTGARLGSGVSGASHWMGDLSQDAACVLGDVQEAVQGSLRSLGTLFADIDVKAVTTLARKALFWGETWRSKPQPYERQVASLDNFCYADSEDVADFLRATGAAEAEVVAAGSDAAESDAAESDAADDSEPSDGGDEGLESTFSQVTEDLGPERSCAQKFRNPCPEYGTCHGGALVQCHVPYLLDGDGAVPSSCVLHPDLVETRDLLLPVLHTLTVDRICNPQATTEAQEKSRAAHFSLEVPKKEVEMLLDRELSILRYEGVGEALEQWLVSTSRPSGEYLQLATGEVQKLKLPLACSLSVTLSETLASIQAAIARACRSAFNLLLFPAVLCLVLVAFCLVVDHSRIRHWRKKVTLLKIIYSLQKRLAGASETSSPRFEGPVIAFGRSKYLRSPAERRSKAAQAIPTDHLKQEVIRAGFGLNRKDAEDFFYRARDCLFTDSRIRIYNDISRGICEEHMKWNSAAKPPEEALVPDAPFLMLLRKPTAAAVPAMDTEMREVEIDSMLSPTR